MIDPNAMYLQFLRERIDPLAGDDPAHPLHDNIYVAPDGLPSGFPGDRRAIVIQLVPGQNAMNTTLGSLRFYVRTYGRAGAVGSAGDVTKSGSDAHMIARFIYQLSYVKQGTRWRLQQGHHIQPDGAGVGRWFAKWIAYDSYPVADNDEDDRPIGFMTATVRADLFRGE